MIREKEKQGLPGVPVFLVFVALLALFVASFVQSLQAPPSPAPVWHILLMVFIGFLFKGFLIVNPNEAKILQFFGNYVGSVKNAGLRWTNPLYTSRTVSLRAVSL